MNGFIAGFDSFIGEVLQRTGMSGNFADTSTGLIDYQHAKIKIQYSKCFEGGGKNKYRKCFRVLLFICATNGSVNCKLTSWSSSQGHWPICMSM
jgi:hypothetical protein